VLALAVLALVALDGLVGVAVAQPASNDGAAQIQAGDGDARESTVPSLPVAQLKPLSHISLDVLHRDEPHPPILDEQLATEDVRRGREDRGFGWQNFAWWPSKLSHDPLYFEDVALERYGQTRCLQPAWSAAHFFGNVVVLPYKMGLDHPHECIYTLGYARAGDCTVPVKGRLPFSLKGLALEAGALTGFVFLFP
jgi:hypothetical protein